MASAIGLLLIVALGSLSARALPAAPALGAPVLLWQNGGCQLPHEYCRTGWYASPAVADLDGDGKAEVIFTTWTQQGSNVAGQLIILNSDGTLLYAVDLPRSMENYDGALGAPTIAHLDSGADYQVVVGTINTGLFAYTLPGSTNTRILWGTGRGSYLRQGRVLCGPTPAPTGIVPTPAGPHLIFLPVVMRGC